ncbi:MAG: bacterial Ig-like domain-containing protein [Bacillota bacterium]
MKKRLLILIAILSVIILAFTACTFSLTSDDDLTIISIDIESLNSYEVYQNDTLNLTGASIMAYYNDGTSEVIAITEDMVGSIDANTLGEQKVTISYGGASTSVTVNVVASSIQSISLYTQPDKFSVVEGESLDTSGISLEVHYQTSSIIISSVSADRITGYSETETTAGTYTVYVTYSGFTTPIELTVYARDLTSVTVATKPTITSYFVLSEDNDETDGFDPNGLVITLNYNNKTTSTITYTESNASDFSFDRNLAIALPAAVVTVTYLGEFTTTFTIEVVTPTVSEVNITTYPKTMGFEFEGEADLATSDITAVIVGDTIDWSTGVATLVYTDGSVVEDVGLDDNSFAITLKTTDSSGTVSYTDYKNSSYDTAGLYTLRLLYGNMGSGTEMSVTVVDKSAKKLLLANYEGVENATYYEGDKINVDLVRYNILYDNGTYLFDYDDIDQWENLSASDLASISQSTAITVTDENVGVVDTIEQEIKYEVEGVTASVYITVNELVIVSASFTAPVKYIYAEGSTTSNINFAGAEYVVKYNNNTSVTVDLQASLIKLYRIVDGEIAANETETMQKDCIYTAVITYDGYSDKSFELKCEDTIVTSVIVNYEGDTNYLNEAAATADFENYSFIIEYSGDTEAKTVYFSDNEVSLYTSILGKTGYIAIQFEYKGVLTSYFYITITGRQVTAIEIKEGRGVTTTYNAGEDFDYSNLVVILSYNDGDKEEVSSFANTAQWNLVFPDIPTADEMTDGSTTELAFKITYVGNSGVASISVPIYVTDKAVASISFDATQSNSLINYNDQLVVTSGAAIVTTGLVIDVTYTDGTSAEIPLQADYLNYDRYWTVTGAQTSTISYGGATVNIAIYITVRAIESISIISLPTTMAYVNGQELDLTGGLIKRVYDDESYDYVTMTGYVTTNYLYDYFDTSFSSSEYYDQRLTFTLISDTSLSVTMEDGEYVRTYRKVTIENYMSFTNTTSFYGTVSTPSITITAKESYFEIPSYTIYYLVDDMWTDVRPSTPGIYSMKVVTEENEYFLGGEIASDNYYMTITKKIIDIVIDNVDKVYNEADPTFTYTADGLVGDDVITLYLYRDYGEDVGSYTIYYSFVDGDNQNDYYYIDRVISQGNLTIAAATITEKISFNGTAGLIYDGSSKIITATYVRDGITYQISRSDLLITYTNSDNKVVVVDSWPVGDDSNDIVYTIRVLTNNYTIEDDTDAADSYTTTFIIYYKSSSSS